MAITITPPLSAPTNATATVTTGGTLTDNTTYYYRIFATSTGGVTGYTGLYGVRNVGIPCAEISATTDTTNKTISLTWDAVTGATGYEVFRATVSGNYDFVDATHRLDPNSSAYFYAPTTTNSLADDGSYPTTRKSILYEDGIPVASIDGSTETSPDYSDDIYNALVSAGLSSHADRIVSPHGQNLTYQLRTTIINNGWWKINEAEDIMLIGKLDYGNGDYGITLGDKGSYVYNPCIFRHNWWYNAVRNFTSNSLKIYNSMFLDVGSLRTQGSYVNFNSSWVYRGRIEIEGSTVAINALQTTGDCAGYIKNSILSWSMQSSGKVFIDNVIIPYTYRGLYFYYATTKNPVAKNMVINSTVKDIHFHKNSTQSTLDAINHKFSNDPFTTSVGTNPTNAIVRMKFELDIKIIDKDGNAIPNATIEIKNKDNTPLTIEKSNSDGKVYLTSGTASSGTTTTLTDTSKSWSTDELTDKLIEIYSGTGKGQERSIHTNTADTITLKDLWETTPDTTSKYRIKIHIHNTTYTGKATTPYYDETDLTPHTIKISKSGYKSYETTFDISEKTNWTIRLAKVLDTNISKNVNFNNQ